MKKKMYNDPVLEIIYIELSDMICASDGEKDTEIDDPFSSEEITNF